MGQPLRGRLPRRFLGPLAKERGTGSLEVKTGVKVGSVAIVEDIALLKDCLSVRTWIGIVRHWIKLGEVRSLTRRSLNMVVRGWSR